MRLYLLILCFFSIEKTFSQIDILETKEKEYPKPPNYDSTYNSGSFKIIMRLTGQTIYFIPHSKKYKGEINKYSSDFLTKKSITVKDPNRPAAFVPRSDLSKETNKVMAQRDAERYPDIFINTYDPILFKNNFLTPVDSIEGKYFVIRGVIENPKLDDNIRHGTYLDLISKKYPGDSLLYKLSGWDSKVPDYLIFGSDFGSYLIQGYYEKLKKQFVNKKFFLTKNIHSIWDVNTGKIIDIDTTNKEWVCNSLTLIETQSREYLQLCLILKNRDKTIAVENENGGLFVSDGWETISILNFKTQEQVLLEKMQAEEIERRRKEAVLIAQEEQKKLLLEKRQIESEMISKYGARIGKLISDNKVIIGMSKEICKLSWGEPYDINRTITKGKVFEQWVYSMGTYLYFENDILVAIQD